MNLARNQPGFTLVELAIVLVIIGLIIGGVIVGADLIKLASQRAQISQIESFRAGAATFQVKFGALPGDISPARASEFNFTIGANCNGTKGFRDGDGLLAGWNSAAFITANPSSENGLFWTDLSTAKLIAGEFPSGGAAYPNCTPTSSPIISLTPGANYVGDYFPVAKIGNGNFVYVYQNGGYNWYGISAVTSSNVNGLIQSRRTLTPIEAKGIDGKVDDGIPATGIVRALYLHNNTVTAVTAPNAATDSLTTCYNTSTAAGVYSTAINDGDSLTCALSFRF